MNLACTIDYLDEADVLGIPFDSDTPGPIVGAIIIQEARPAKGTIMQWVRDPEQPNNPDLGQPVQFDLLENAEVHENPDGTLRIYADSMRAEGAFGVGKSKINLRVTPR